MRTYRMQWPDHVTTMSIKLILIALVFMLVLVQISEAVGECDCTTYGCSLLPFWFDFVNNIHTAEAWTNYSVSVFASSLDPDGSCTMKTNIQYYSEPTGGWTNLPNTLPNKMSDFGCFFDDASSCQRNIAKNTWQSISFIGLNASGTYTMRAYADVHKIQSANYSLVMNDSLPTIEIIQPFNSFNQTSKDIEIECSATDMQGIDNITLFHNISGSMVQNQTWYNQPDNSKRIFWARLDNGNLTSEENIPPSQAEGLAFVDGRKGDAINMSVIEQVPLRGVNLTYPINNSIGFNLTDGTYSAWYKLDATTGSVLNRGLVALGNYNMTAQLGAASTYGDFFYVYYNNGVIILTSGREGSIITRVGLFNWNPGSWHHFLISWKDSGVSKSVDVYIDGIQFMRNQVMHDDLDDSSNISIGSFVYSTNFFKTEYQFNGPIDEIQVFYPRLTMEESYNLFRNGTAKHNFTIENVDIGTYNFTCRTSDNFFQKENYWSNETEADSSSFNIDYCKWVDEGTLPMCIMNCSDNPILNSNYGFSSSNINVSFTGNGIFTLDKNLSNWNVASIMNSCTLNNPGGLTL